MRLTRGKLGLLAALAACAIAAVAAVPAQGLVSNASIQAVDGDIFAGGDGPGGSTDFNLASGTTTILDNTDADTTHNVTAAKPTAFPVTLNGPDGGPLFRSGDVFPNESATVAGVQYLADGSYDFYCTIHPSSAQGTLEVSGSDPVPRPKISVAIKASKLGTVLKKGKIPVSVHADTQSSGVTLQAKLGKTKLASEKGLNLGAGSTRKLSLKLTGAGRNALKGKSKAKLTLVGSVSFGASATAAKKLG